MSIIEKIQLTDWTQAIFAVRGRLAGTKLKLTM